MRQEGNLYYAHEGNLIVRKRDGFVMGDCICLGSADHIENYAEEAFSEEDLRAFYGTEKASADEEESE